MATLNTLGVDSLSLRGAGNEYNSLSRVFKTKAEADAALASGDWTPTVGRMNLCVTGDQGVLRVDDNGALVTADDATRAYIDAQVQSVVGDAPAVLDSLGELSDAMADDPNFFATMASANTTLQEAINTEVSRATAAETAIQNDVDANETAANTAIAAEETRATAAEAAEATRATAAEAAIQADVDQNEADADAAIAAENTRAVAAEAAIQADVDANEAAQNADLAAEAARAGAAEAAIQADVDQNEADADAAVAAVQADVDAVEAAAATARTNLQTALQNAIDAVQADADQNEADADAAIATKFDKAGGVLTGSLVVAKSFPDLHLKANDEKRVLFSDAGGGSTAAIKHVSSTLDFFAGGIASSNKEMSIGTDGVDVSALKIAGTAVTATAAELNYVDGVTSNVQTQLDAIQADVDQNETDSDAAIAVERGRIDAILSGASADTDTFAEVVALVNSVDTTNDNAFAGYVTSNDAAVAAVQADVDQNETDGDAADAALGVRIDNVETEIDTARANLYAAVGRNENETHLGVFSGSTISSNTSIRAALQELETDTESRLSRLGGTLTGNLTLRKGDGSAVALELSRADHADMNVVWKLQPSYVSATKEVLTVLANGQVVAHFDERQRFAINMNDPDYTLDVGGDGHFSTNLVVGGTLTLGSTAITATGAELNYVDGVTSNVQTQLDAIQADVDQNESDADTAIALKANAADSALTGVTSMEDLDVASGKITFNTSSNVLVTSGITASTAAGGSGILTVSGAASLTGGCIVSGSALNATAGFSIGGVAVTATAAELNYVDGVTSSIQTQLDAKLAAETITMTAFKAVVAASSDFGDFQTRVAAL